MALADPQSLTIGSALTLPRTGTGVGSGFFQTADGNVKLSVAHQYAKNRRIRRTVRVDHRKIAADPLVTAQNLQYSSSVYVVVDQPEVGYSVTDLTQVVTGLTTWLTASTNANTIKVLGAEI